MRAVSTCNGGQPVPWWYMSYTGVVFHRSDWAGYVSLSYWSVRNIGVQQCVTYARCRLTTSNGCMYQVKVISLYSSQVNIVRTVSC